MLCQNCHQHPATTYVRRTINGQSGEWHLCAACAAKQSLGDVWGMLGFNMDALFAPPVQSEPCVCGFRFEDIVSTGKAGCPRCYETFYEQLLPSIERIHGKGIHTGKTPMKGGESGTREKLAGTVQKAEQGVGQTAPETSEAPADAEKKSEKFSATPAVTKDIQNSGDNLQTLKKQLAAAVEAQQYEDCARLRDEIRALESGRADNNNNQKDGERA
ncbi:MAG: UvrB/UvrC motif-containing protein [Oscillospiraceae bacterium]|nr:UvrB/UvrC motif-containing protein [Oscillospiraceae bacterium]